MKLIGFSPLRLAVGYVALSVLVLALFAIPLWYAWHVNFGTLRTYVDATEFDAMAELFRKEGAKGLAAAIDARAARAADDEVMLLADPARARVAGNLPAWPAGVPDTPGTSGLVIDTGGTSMRVVVTHLSLPGGYHLLMGRESARFQSLVDLFWYGIAGATAIALLLGATVGWMIRRALLAEVGEISRTAAAIVQGDPTRRLVMRGQSAELGVLERTVNGMLEQLARQNVQLADEIAVRRQAEQALHRAHDDLEKVVAERTEQLARAFHDTQTLTGQFQLAIDTIPGLVWSSLPDGHIDFLNKRWRDYTGLTLAQASGWGWQAAIHPDDLPGLVEYWKSVLSSGMPGETEARLRRHDGEYRWFLFRGVPVYDDDGKLLKWYGTNTDIEDRKCAEATLEGEKRMLELIARGNPLQATLDALCRLVEKTFDGYLCSILLLDPKAGQLVHGAAPSLPHSYVAAVNGWPLSAGPCGLAASLGEPVIAADIPAEARWADYRALAAAHGLRSCWSTPIVSSDGKVLGTFAILSREAGRPEARHLGTIEQVTHLASIAIERKRAEEALRTSEERFALAMAAAGEGHWDWKIATDDFYASPRMLEMYGFPPDTVFPNRADFISRFPFHPEDRPKWEKAAASHFTGDTARFDMELRMVPRGEVRWIHLSGICLRDAEGRPVRWTGSVTDVTERKHVEEELRARQELLDLAQKAAHAVAFEWHVDPGARPSRWPPDLEAIYGLAPGAYDGTYEAWKALVHPEDWRSVKDAIEVAKASGNIATEYRVVHPDGTVRWVQARGRMFFDPDGRPERIVGFMQDVTDRRHAEEELRRLERRLRQAQRLEAMGTLAGGIAHDFNNILGAILGYGEMALRDVPQGSRLRRDLDSILAAGERGRALVDRILTFSRSGVGERIAVHVEAVVRESLDMLAPNLPAGIAVKASLQTGRAAIQGDPTQVHQVLMNLATNAIQAMPGGGTLGVTLRFLRVDAPRVATIGTLEAAEYIVLEVADTGSGIAPEVLDRVFDPFFSTKEVGVGTGLGLSLVHGIATEMGGAIDVSTTVGTGTAFTVYMPRSGDAAYVAGNGEKAPPRGSGQRVLVVDDEEPLVRLTTDLLQKLGYAPVGFTSPAAALQAFRAAPGAFDAVLTDERMPGMSGSTLIREVRGIRRSVPILLVSGYVGGMVMNRAYNEGANEVLKKPLSSDDLATSLARVLYR